MNLPLELWRKRPIKIRVDDQTTRKAVGLAVKELRLRRGISQERLAIESRIDRSYMSGVEHGQHNPTIDLLIRMCKPLRVNLPSLARAVERYWIIEVKNATGGAVASLPSPTPPPKVPKKRKATRIKKAEYATDIFISHDAARPIDLTELKRYFELWQLETEQKKAAKPPDVLPAPIPPTPKPPARRPTKR